ncbi:MAG: IclR family transcriptional regulator C-terminal domain-containing protein [Marmoricola sp.]
MRGMLQQTRQRGHALEEGDITQGLSSVALPVFDHLGLPAAALGITFPASHPTRTGAHLDGAAQGHQ